MESYAGYITVNETWNSNLFFWFFPAQVGGRPAGKLVVLQLQDWDWECIRVSPKNKYKNSE